MKKKKSKNFNKIRKKKNWTINYPGGVLIKLQNLGNT